MQKVSGAIGIKFAAETAFNFILTIVIIVFAKKNHLMKHLGLCKSEVSICPQNAVLRTFGADRLHQHIFWNRNKVQYNGAYTAYIDDDFCRIP